MHLKAISKDALKETLRQACFAPSHEVRRSMMVALEQMEHVPGFIWMLVRVVDTNDLGSDLPLPCRQLAAIMLKTLALKHWQNNNETACLLDEDSSEESFSSDEVLSDSERDAVRHFLQNYLHEPDCQIASQLSLLVSSIAQIDYPNKWPTLLTNLIGQIDSQHKSVNAMSHSGNELSEAPMPNTADNFTSLLQCYRASTYLRDALLSLSTRPGFAPLLLEVCLSHFPFIARAWALNARQIQSHISRFIQQLQDPMRFQRDYTFELQCYHTVMLMDILKLFLEFGLPNIVEKFPCFSNFWKTYLASIQMSCVFIQKARPVCRALAKSQSTASQSNAANFYTNSKSRELSVVDALHRQAILSLDADNNYFIPLEWCCSDATTQSQYCSSLFVTVNTALVLLRCQNCTPIVLQRKYPLHVTQWLEPLLTFYIKHLNEERLERRQCSESGDVLPLKYLSIAATAFISNVLNCEEYLKAAPLDISATVGSGAAQGNNVSSNGAFGEELVHCVPRTGSHANSVLANPTLQAQLASQARHIVFSQFANDRIYSTMDLLCKHCLCYDNVDLALWTTEPEEFFTMDNQAASKPLVSICAMTITQRLLSQQIFQGLCKVSSLVCKYLFDKIANVDEQLRVISLAANLSQLKNCPTHLHCSNQDAFNDLLYWDSLYFCVGQSLSLLTEQPKFNIEQWVMQVLNPLFRQLLSHEAHGSIVVKSSDSSDTTVRVMQIMRARLLWLLTQMLPYLRQSLLLNELLQFLVSLLSSSNSTDIVVRLRAATTIHALVVHDQFPLSALVPQSIVAVDGLCKLLMDCQQLDCGILICQTLREIIRCIGVVNTQSISAVAVDHDSCVSCYLGIANRLSTVWQSVDSTDVIRSELLSVFVSLVKAANEDSSTLLSITLPVLFQSFGLVVASNHEANSRARFDSPSETKFLWNDAMVLWVTMMRNLQTAITNGPTQRSITSAQQAQDLTLLVNYVLSASVGDNSPFQFIMNSMETSSLTDVNAQSTRSSFSSLSTNANANVLESKLNSETKKSESQETEEFAVRLLSILQCYAILLGNSLFTSFSYELWMQLGKLLVGFAWGKELPNSNRVKDCLLHTIAIFLTVDSKHAVQWLSETGILIRLVLILCSSAFSLSQTLPASLISDQSQSLIISKQLSVLLKDYHESDTFVCEWTGQCISRCVLSSPQLMVNALNAMNPIRQQLLQSFNSTTTASEYLQQEDLFVDQMFFFILASGASACARSAPDSLLQSRLSTLAAWSLLSVPCANSACGAVSVSGCHFHNWWGLSWQRASSWMSALIRLTLCSHVALCNVLDLSLTQRVKQLHRQLALRLSCPHSNSSDSFPCDCLNEHINDTLSDNTDECSSLEDEEHQDDSEFVDELGEDLVLHHWLKKKSDHQNTTDDKVDCNAMHSSQSDEPYLYVVESLKRINATMFLPSRLDEYRRAQTVKALTTHRHKVDKISSNGNELAIERDECIYDQLVQSSVICKDVALCEDLCDRVLQALSVIRSLQGDVVFNQLMELVRTTCIAHRDGHAYRLATK